MKNQNPAFADLLTQAVNEPGILSSAYRNFHNYSLGNQILAWIQCLERRIPPEPLATFTRWQELGRHVKRGERALTLCMPVTRKRTETATADDGTEQVDEFTWKKFIYRPNWFVLSQTDGKEVPTPPLPSWAVERALVTLDVREVPFGFLDGNVMGYARRREIAVSPVNPMPWKTRFHELAHVLLGHTSEGDQNDGELTPRNLREVEAESVALLCCAALGLPGAEFSRGYVQCWWGARNAIPERSAQKILCVADKILKAGSTEGEVRS